MLYFPEHSVFCVLLHCGDVQNFAYCGTFCGDSYFDVATAQAVGPTKLLLPTLSVLIKY
jgi:hypothetical protein